ncbi:hypothetical protein JZ751_024418 [Albula glossodonta]|uniref:Cytokine receptor-like factor 2-like D1 domain-containing protein n=1 Tax=Albula glossodonta TaxID=121402 RepID=A0A8T2NF71_9TELE|nr:hypothetical protein JZ751_024418 [Albula glossodonta]
MLLEIFLFISHLGCVYSSLPNVSCTIINLEYIDCTWKDHGIPKFNYSFSSSLQNRALLECPDYLLEENQPVGCRLPYEKGNKFKTLSTILFSASNHLNKTQEIKLQDRVKLHPPQNLSVQLPSSSELWLYWNVSTKFECLQFEVSYKRDTDSDWDWLHISKEFVEGFKPNFSEPSCPVREYSIVPQTSISGSECSLPILLDQSDCLDTSCSTATSSISASPENTPPGLV